MGLDINTVLFLIDARKRGAALGEMLTLGRQEINVYPRKMVSVLKKHGLPWEGYAPSLRNLPSHVSKRWGRAVCIRWTHRISRAPTLCTT